MAFSEVSSCSLPPSVQWDSLVTRSIKAWEGLARDAPGIDQHMPIYALQDCNCLDDLFCKAPGLLMFWFFQRRDAFLSQKTMTKWSRDVLDDYVLLPASPGFVTRRECFFVSHFWRTQEHPDPDGEYLRLFQADLQRQHWSYVWVDWTCIPQSPHSPAEEAYFLRSLETMSGIIRNAGFMWVYPPFEARMWILYEITEFTLTSSTDLETTSDIVDFRNHVQEMVQTSVRSVLDKYSYRCTHDRDKAFLTSWLEILVLLTRLRIEILYIRRLMDYMTWTPTSKTIVVNTANACLQLSKFQGTFLRNGERYTFTPFPEWDGGKYSAKRHS